jgi:hypothetical protein
MSHQVRPESPGRSPVAIAGYRTPQRQAMGLALSIPGFAPLLRSRRWRDSLRHESPHSILSRWARSVDQQEHDRFLRVKTVLGLVVDY